MKCYILILNYNSFTDTLECIQSVYQSLDKEQIQLIVIDNASTNNSYAVLKEKLPVDVTLLKSDLNRGYANGNNIGIKYAVEHGAEYICILNNDVIVEEDFLTPCIEALNIPNTGFVSPRITDYKTGLLQNTGGNIAIQKGNDITLNKGVVYTQEMPPLISCDIVYGSCIVFKSEIIKKVGMIPEDYFLFYEETDWCYHAHVLGYSNKSVTTVTVRHKGGSSTDHFAGTGLVPYLYERNQIVFTKKYLSKYQFIRFLFFDFFRTIYQERKQPSNIIKRLSWRRDGVFGRVNPKYSFIYVSNRNASDIVAKK